jgi:cytochrome c biogenesis protein CcmG/thiol:disulfide interchange protein DsbE
MKRWILWAPLALFIAFVTVVALGLRKPGNNVIRSQLIGKPMPEFNLPPAIPARPSLATVNLRDGRAHLVNIFASWCVPCAAETPQLLKLTAMGVPVEAVAIRDRSKDIQRFLAQWGDPYDRIGGDPDSSVQIALGSSGVPESFVVDGKGIIRHQHIGDIRDEDVADIFARVRAAQ